MRKMIGLLAGAILMTGIATMAQAIPLSLTVIDGISSATGSDNGAGLADNNQYLDTFSINPFATGFEHPLSSRPAALHLSAGQIYNTGTLTFTLHDNNPSLPNLVASLSPDAVTNLGRFNALANALEVKGTEIWSFPGISADHTGSKDMDRSLFDLTNPVRLTEMMPLDFGTTASTTSFDSSVKTAPTPEPGTMMLLGAGFLGLAIYGKRRKNT